MTQELAAPQKPSDDLSYRSPQVSILDLFVLITVMAIIFVVTRNMPIREGLPNPADPSWKAVFGMSRALGAGISIAGLVLAVKAAANSKCLALYPGHLLLIYCGSTVVLNFKADLLYAVSAPMLQRGAFDQDQVVRFFELMTCTHMAISLLLTGLVSYGTWHYQKRWRFMFAIVMLSLLLNVTFLGIFLADSVFFQDGSLLRALPKISIALNALMISVLVSLIICTVSDLVSGTKRDWPHWWGIAAMICVDFVPRLMTMIALHFLGPAKLFGL